MQTKRIICPNCRAILEVKNSKNEEVMHFPCPGCKTPLKVIFGLQQEPIEAHTYIAPSPSQQAFDGETQLGGIGDAVTQLADYPTKSLETAKLVHDGVSYELEEGQNIIGRKGTTSKATVQIATEDRYMSRQHCAIRVTTLLDGTKKAVLSNYQNKNLTSIDEQEIETGDEIRLTDGNSITMGHTTVTFKLS